MKTGRPRKPLEVGAKYGRLTVEGEGDFRVESYSGGSMTRAREDGVAVASIPGALIGCTEGQARGVLDLVSARPVRVNG